MFAPRRPEVEREDCVCLRPRVVVMRDAVLRPVEPELERAFVRVLPTRRDELAVDRRVLFLADARLPRAFVLRLEAERPEVERPDVPRPEALREDALRDVVRVRPVPLLCERDDVLRELLLRRLAPRCPVLRVPALRLCEPRALLRVPSPRPPPLA